MKPERLLSAVSVRRSISAELRIHARIEKVYNALATANGIKSWWTDDAESEHKAGGAVRYIWNTEAEPFVLEGYFSDLQQPKVVEVEFTVLNGKSLKPDGDNPRGAHWRMYNRFELRPEGNTKTYVSLLDSGVAIDRAFDQYYTDILRGWRCSLANLKSVCEIAKDQRAEIHALL